MTIAEPTADIERPRLDTTGTTCVCVGALNRFMLNKLAGAVGLVFGAGLVVGESGAGTPGMSAA